MGMWGRDIKGIYIYVEIMGFSMVLATSIDLEIHGWFPWTIIMLVYWMVSTKNDFLLLVWVIGTPCLTHIHIE